MIAPLLSQLVAAKNGLEDAQIALCGAVTAHAEAKRARELAEAHKLCEGVEGRNEKERAAKLRLELVKRPPSTMSKGGTTRSATPTSRTLTCVSSRWCPRRFTALRR